MPEAKFVLKDPKADKETLVYLIFRFNNERLKYSTGEKIDPKFWSATKQRAKEIKDFKTYPEFNQYLKHIDNSVNACYLSLKSNAEVELITPELLKEELKKALNQTTERKITLFKFIEDYIKQITPLRKKGSVEVYQSTLNVLKGYATYKKVRVDFDTINLNFYNDFSEYVSKKLMRMKNTEGKYIKTLKSFLTEATERGLNTNLEYKSKRFKVVKETADTIYLTLDELQKIKNLNLSEKLHFDRIRDLFLVGCYTGLRFSDFSKIKPENIIDNTIVITTAKTDEKVVIPLNPVVREIISKYDGGLPREISNQKMNTYLKDIVQLAEVDTLTMQRKTKGNKTVKESLPKYKLVSTHTARRSFATNAFKSGVPAISIMKITGHKTEKAFMAYIKISQEENAKILAMHPFFNTEMQTLKAI
jgi:integrase